MWRSKFNRIEENRNNKTKHLLNESSCWTSLMYFSLISSLDFQYWTEVHGQRIEDRLVVLLIKELFLTNISFHYWANYQLWVWFRREPLGALKITTDIFFLELANKIKSKLMREREGKKTQKTSTEYRVALKKRCWIWSLPKLSGGKIDKQL